MVTPFFHALCFLCVLGGAVLASVSMSADASRWAIGRSVLALVFGFAAAIVWARPHRLPEPVTVASLSAGVAALKIARPKYTVAPALFGGVLAGLSASLLQVYGLPVWIALPLVALSPAVAVLLTIRSPYFAPADLKEEALLGLLAFSLLSALAPVLIAGWQSASALNLEGGRSVNFTLPAWTLALALASMLLGGAYAVWRRR